MSAKSKSSKALGRPFDKAILTRAREIAGQYKIVLEREHSEWYGHGLEIPGAMGGGKTPETAVAETREAMTSVVAYMLEEGQTPPAPAREGKRSVQVNVRLTPEERAKLESRSRAQGFRGLSDFIRATVLEK